MPPQARHRLLFAVSGAVLLAMLGVTIRASLQRSLFDQPAELTSDPWFQATLCDAYCGFLLFYQWIAVRERTFAARGVWFVLMMTLGNIAAAIYLLRELWRTRRSYDLRELLLPRSSPAP